MKHSILKMLLLALGVNLGLNPAMAMDDPTRPPGYPLATARGKSMTAPVWNVSAIRIASKQKTAVVNGRTVAVGNRVNGATVIDIEPSEVKFKKADKEFSVRLFANRVKKITRVPVK